MPAKKAGTLLGIIKLRDVYKLILKVGRKYAMPRDAPRDAGGRAVDVFGHYNF